MVSVDQLLGHQKQIEKISIFTNAHPSNMKVIGVDIGSQKTMMVADDGDIVLTDTGSISRPTLVAFYGKSRLVGEEAAPQISGDSTLSLLNLLMGQSADPDADITAHRRVALSSSSSGLLVEVSYMDKKETFSVTAVLAIFISKLFKRARAVYGEDIQLSFVLPPNSSASVPRAIKEACQIADIAESVISFADMADCIVATYGRKLQALRGTEKTFLEVRNFFVHTELKLKIDQLTRTPSHVNHVEQARCPGRYGTHADNGSCCSRRCVRYRRASAGQGRSGVGCPSWVPALRLPTVQSLRHHLQQAALHGGEY